MFRLNKEKEYSLTKMALIIALLWYPFIGGYFLLVGVVTVSGSNGPQASELMSVVFKYATVIALFLSLVCLATAKYFYDKKRIRIAINFLRTPFIYGFVFALIFFLI
jgi:hypothetical protein